MSQKQRENQVTQQAGCMDAFILYPLHCGYDMLEPQLWRWLSLVMGCDTDKLPLLPSCFFSEGFATRTEGTRMVPLVYLAQLNDLEHGCCPRECCTREKASCLPWSQHGLRRQEQYTPSSVILLFKP